MKSKLKGGDGFTLIEVMIVVAIIGILAAIAIPQFQMFIAKSKRVEGIQVLNGIFKAQIGFYATYDTYTTSGTAYDTLVILGLQDLVTLSGGISKTHHGYEVSIDGICQSVQQTCFMAQLGQDLDKTDPFWEYLILMSPEHLWATSFPANTPIVAQDDITNTFY